MAGQLHCSGSSMRCKGDYSKRNDEASGRGCDRNPYE